MFQRLSFSGFSKKKKTLVRCFAFYIWKRNISGFWNNPDKIISLIDNENTVETSSSLYVWVKLITKKQYCLSFSKLMNFLLNFMSLEETTSLSVKEVYEKRTLVLTGFIHSVNASLWAQAIVSCLLHHSMMFMSYIMVPLREK